MISSFITQSLLSMILASNKLQAFLRSQFARLEIVFNISSFNFKFGYLLKIFSSLFLKKSKIFCSVKGSKTSTLQRESRALFIVKLGFSVVAPINVMSQLSTNGNNASCCALFRRWISSKNNIVFVQYALF